MEVEWLWCVLQQETFYFKYTNSTETVTVQIKQRTRFNSNKMVGLQVQSETFWVKSKVGKVFKVIFQDSSSATCNNQNLLRIPSAIGQKWTPHLCMVSLREKIRTPSRSQGIIMLRGIKGTTGSGCLHSLCLKVRKGTQNDLSETVAMNHPQVEWPTRYPLL